MIFKRARLSRGRLIWFLAYPHPFPVSATHTKTEKERQLADGREGDKGCRQAVESYERKKAWASINYSILSRRKQLKRKMERLGQGNTERQID
jgi:hypothetical protein